MEACARPRPLPPTNGRDSPRRLNCLTDLQTTGYPGDYVTSNVTKEAPCRIEIRIALVICVIHSQQLKCFENCLFIPDAKRGVITLMPMSVCGTVVIKQMDRFRCGFFSSVSYWINWVIILNYF